MIKIPHSILITFDSSESNQKPIKGVMKISNAIDKFYLYESRLTIEYTRSKHQSIDDAFNMTRCRRLEELWLINYSVFERMPKVSQVTLTSANNTIEASYSGLDLPTLSQTLSSESFFSANVATKILNSRLKDDIIISISYLIASKQPGLDPMNRFRFLWSAFNPLYESFSTKGYEWEKAKSLVCELDNRGMIKDACSSFSQAPEPNSHVWRLGKWFSNFKPLRLDKNRDRFKFANSVKVITGDADIKTLKAITSRYQYQACSQIPKDKNPISNKIESGNSDEGSFFRFVMRDYLYWLRCDTMHGSSIYPIFMTTEQRQLIEVLNSSLEKIVIESVRLCASL